MTLGEFRKITEQYPDEATLCWSDSKSSIGYSNLVDEVVIVIGSSTDAEPNPTPNIIVI